MDCPSLIPNVNYGVFSKRLHKAVIKDRIPVGGSIDLTSRCNLKCFHCYVDNSPGNKEMGTEELFLNIDKITDAGCLWMLFTGGEPLLRPDFKDIYIYAKRKGLLINLFTNATLLNEEIADLLYQWQPFAVEVSLYGHTPETYEAVTGVKGSFEKCMSGIELLRERKIPLRLKSMILTINQHELADMIEFARGLGIEFRYDSNIHSRISGSPEPCEYRLSPEEIIKLDFYDKRRIKALRELVDFSSGHKLDKNQIFHCGAGLNSFHIDASGNLHICMMYRREGVSLSDATFREAWDSHILDVRFQKPRGDYVCSRCEHYFLCGQCPGWSGVESGDIEKPTEFLCRLAHKRAQAFAQEPLWTGSSKKKY